MLVYMTDVPQLHVLKLASTGSLSCIYRVTKHVMDGADGLSDHHLSAVSHAIC